MKVKLFFLYIFQLIFSQVVFAQDTNKQTLEKAGKELYNNPKNAINLALKVFHHPINDDEKISSYLILIRGYSSINQYEKAIDYSYQAYDFTKEIENYDYQIMILGIIGNQFQELNLNTKAREYLDKAEVIVQKHIKKDVDKHRYMGNIYGIKANSFQADLDCNFALQYYDKSLKEYSYINDLPSKRNTVLVNIYKAKCYESLNNNSKAKSLYNLAIEQNKTLNLFEYQADAMIGLAKINFEEENYQNSLELLLEIYNNPQYEHLTIRLKSELSKLLSKLYLELDNDSLYMKFHQEFIFYNDSIKKSKETIIQQSSAYLIHEKNIENDEKSKIYNIVFRIFIFVFMILIMIVLYKVFKFRKL